MTQGSVATVVAAFSRALGGRPVCADDDFCLLGGDETAALRLAGEVSVRIGAAVRAHEVFDHPTPARYAARLACLSADTADRPPAPVPTTRPVPLGPAQERFLLIERATGRALFNAVQRVDLVGEVDHDALAAAALDVAARHAALRLRLCAAGSVLAQRADSEVTTGVTRHVVEPDALAAMIADLTATRAGEPFDFVRHQPVRLDLVPAGPDRAVLLVTTHHATVDGRSMGILRRDLAAAYRARVCGDRPDGSALQITDVMSWQHTRIAAAGERHLAYWQDSCASSAGRPADDQHSDAIQFTLPEPAVRAAAADRAVTASAVLLACYLLAVHAHLADDTDPLAAFVQLDNREWASTADVVATLSNMLPVTVASADLDLPDRAISAAHHALRSASRHQELPAEVALAWLGDVGLPRYGFTMLEPEGQPIPVPGGHMSGRSLGPTADGSDRAPFDLVLEVRPLTSVLDCRLTYGMIIPGARRAAAVAETFRSSVRQVTMG